MNTKTLLAVLVLAVLALGAAFVAVPKTEPSPSPSKVSEEGKLKVGNFEGIIEEVNTGCYADGECYVVVDGKHITTLMGWSRDTVGVADLDALNANMGKTAEVYAKDNGDGTYTLYGSEGFYVRVKE